jgi:hypothetical protein
VILPRGHAAYENLSTSFTKFSELLEELKANSFTGYVEVNFWEYDGVVFMDSGTIMTAVEETQGGRITGQRAVSSILSQAEEKNGSVSVYGLSAEMVTLLIGSLNSEVVHKNLNTEFSNLEQLMINLRDEGLTGTIEVAVRGGKGNAIVFMRSGEIVESVLSASGEVVSGTRVLPHILDMARNLGATFSVYRASLEDAFSETAQMMVGLELSQVLEVWQDVVGTIESVVDDRLGEGSFLRLFKDALIEKADDYPFVDPFAREFEYAGGQITYTGPMSADVNLALSECMASTLEKVSQRFPRPLLASEISDRLASVEDKHTDTITKLGLRTRLWDLLSQE